MKNAQMAQSPLVLIGGAAATVLKGRGSLQDVEQVDVLRSIAKYHASVRNVREIVPILRRAFHEAMSGVPGPVFVEIPIDCVCEYIYSLTITQISVNHQHDATLTLPNTSHWTHSLPSTSIHSIYRGTHSPNLQLYCIGSYLSPPQSITNIIPSMIKYLAHCT